MFIYLRYLNFEKTNFESTWVFLDFYLLGDFSLSLKVVLIYCWVRRKKIIFPLQNFLFLRCLMHDYFWAWNCIFCRLFFIQLWIFFIQRYFLLTKILKLVVFLILWFLFLWLNKLNFDILFCLFGLTVTEWGKWRKLIMTEFSWVNKLRVIMMRCWFRMWEINKLLEINMRFLFEYESIVFFLTERILDKDRISFNDILICFTIESFSFEFFLFDKIISVLFGIELLKKLSFELFSSMAIEE